MKSIVTVRAMYWCVSGLIIVNLAGPLGCGSSNDFSSARPKNLAPPKAADATADEPPLEEEPEGEDTAEDAAPAEGAPVAVQGPETPSAEKPKAVPPPGTQLTEVFPASSLGMLDLQIVIDNSASMADEQVNMASKLGALLTAVSASDWRINITTTDPKDGCQRAIVKKGDANAAAAFSSAVQAGTNGSGTEQSVFQAIEGLKGTCSTQGPWVRPHSSVAVLFVTDEDNCSSGHCIMGSPQNEPEALVTLLSSQRVIGESARAYGLFWHPSQTRANCLVGESKASQLASLVELTKGTWGSICDHDYSTTLNRISKDMATILKNRFILKRAPRPESVRVYGDGEEITAGYQVNGNVVHFSDTQAFKKEVKIVYESK